METKRKLTLASLAFTAVAGGSLLVASQTQAFERVGSSDFAHALASRFNLNVDEVTAFLDEQHAQHKQELFEDMEDRLTDRLDQAVADGKLTAEQKASILAKHEEMKTWADAQGIDMKWIGGMPMKMRTHHR